MSFLVLVATEVLASDVRLVNLSCVLTSDHTPRNSLPERTMSAIAAFNHGMPASAEAARDLLRTLD